MKRNDADVSNFDCLSLSLSSSPTFFVRLKKFIEHTGTRTRHVMHSSITVSKNEVFIAINVFFYELILLTCSLRMWISANYEIIIVIKYGRADLKV